MINYRLEKAKKELNRVKKLPVAAPENAILRNYLDVLTDLPWDKKTKDNKDIKKAPPVIEYVRRLKNERETGFEPATSTLARLRSTS